MKKFLTALCITTLSVPCLACTGITLHARDGATVSARTIDWAQGDTNNIYTIVPRGHVSRSLLPDGTQNGMEFVAKYGFVGLGPERPEFIVDGTNEAGLNAGLFYFPEYQAFSVQAFRSGFQEKSWKEGDARWKKQAGIHRDPG